MTKNYWKAVLLCTLFFFTISCTKDDTGVFPEGYDTLYDAFLQHKQFKSARIRSRYFTVVFPDGESVSIDTDVIMVEDCRFSPKKDVTVGGNGKILVGGTDTGISSDTSLSDDMAAPVYLSFDDKVIRIALRNGNTLEIPTNKKLPVLYIKTKDLAEIVSREEYVEGTLTICDRTGLYPEMDGFSTSMKIRGRGNSTWGMPKKPWKLKLNEKARMFGMSKDKEWCLLAEYCDKTLMRNLVAMQLSEICGFSWTPRMISVDVYLNDKYQGVYSFSEHKKVSSERVDIDTGRGDIYFEIEQNQDNPVCWYTGIYNVPMMFSDPDEPDYKTIDAGKKVFSDFEKALSAEYFDDPDTGYAAHIDIKSFIDNYIIQELTKNIDGDLRKSTFLTKTVDGKLEMYHVWDFDLTIGNCDYFAGEVGRPISNGYTGWYVRDFSSAGYHTGWYYRLFQDPAFVQKVIERWNLLYPLFKARIPEFIEDQYALLEESAKDNFETWNILSTYVWPNVVITGSYRGEVDYMKKFFLDRLEWMNTQFRKM